MQQDPILTPLFTSRLVGAGLPTATAVLGFSVSIPALLSAATMLAGSVALNMLLAPEAPKPEQAKIPLKQTVLPRFAGFGQVLLSGGYALFETAGTDSVDVLALAQGPGFFERFLLSEKKATVNGSGVVQEMEGGAYAGGVVTLQVRRGEALETAYSIGGLSGSFGPTIWTPDHRGDRVMSLFLRCRSVKRENFAKVYPTGLPKPSAVLFLPCWDFRDPAQDPDDPDTWIDYPAYDPDAAYVPGDRVLHGGLALGGGPAGGMLWLCLEAASGVAPSADARKWAAVWKNPVLQAVTFLTSSDIGMGLPREHLITPALAALAARAAQCDEPVPRKDGSFEPRYAGCPWWRLDTHPEEVLGQILGACDGWVGLDGVGRLALEVGVYAAPTEIVDEDAILDVDLAFGKEDEARLDELTLTVTSPAHDYTSQPVEPWRNEAAILARGKVRSEAFGPTSVQSHAQLRRLAKRLMARANALNGAIVTHLGGLAFAGRRYLRVRYPAIPELADAVIEVRRRTVSWMERRCTYEFVVVDPATVDAWDPATEEGEAPPSPDGAVTAALPIPQNVEGALIAHADGRLSVLLSWDEPAGSIEGEGRPDLTYVARYRLTGSLGDPPGEWVEQAIVDPTVADGRVQAQVFLDIDGEAYEAQVASVGSGGSRSHWSDSAFPIVAEEVDFLLLDLPVIAAGEVAGVPRLAATAPNWHGAKFYRAPDGESFAQADEARREATMGETTGNFPAGPTGRWDRTNVLTVQIPERRSLASASEAAVLAGANLAAVRNEAGEWELLQFATATPIGGGVWELSDLLRGQYGSEHAMRTPLAAGAAFVLLDAAAVPSGVAASERGNEWTWRWGPRAFAPTDPAYQEADYAFAGVGLRPYSPVHLAQRLLANGDLHLTWTRRTRVGGDSWEDAEVPLGEEEETYELEVLDGSTVVRTVTGLGGPAYLYTAAKQVEDFGAAQVSVAFRVYQTNKPFGRGIPAEVSA